MIDLTDMPTAAELRKCVGSSRFGIEPHEAPPADFPAQPSAKDGLGRMCRVHWNQYTSGLARDAKARKAGTEPTPGEAIVDAVTAAIGEPLKRKAKSAPKTSAGAKVSVKPARQSQGRLLDGLAAQLAEHAELERQLEAVGGAGSDAGQALLEAAATRAAEARTSRQGAKEPTEVAPVDASA